MFGEMKLIVVSLFKTAHNNIYVFQPLQPIDCQINIAHQSESAQLFNQTGRRFAKLPIGIRFKPLSNQKHTPTPKHHERTIYAKRSGKIQNH